MKNTTSFWPALEEAKNTMSTIHKGYPRNTDMLPGIKDSEKRGSNHVIAILREISVKGANALLIASYVLSNLDTLRRSSPVLDTMLAEIEADKNLAAYMSEVGILLSKLNSYKIERLETAIIYCHELFNRENLDCPLEEYLDEFKE
ncbi:hypothetical protein [Parabacteroides leei]|uniref:hypothetical protein n=1 Tax=Parabacteroides leei TaxID=2939491 RepID=UPI00189ADE8F|nr:hypothetical protein [Parabacteroides goldsteinii]